MEKTMDAAEKQFVAKRSNTQVQITEKGRKAIENHWQQLENLHRDTKRWKPDEGA